MVYQLLGKSNIREESVWGEYKTLEEAKRVLSRKRAVYSSFNNLNYKFRIKKK